MTMSAKLIEPEARSAWQLARANWLLIGAMGASVGLGMAAFGFSIDAWDFGIVLAIAALYGTMGWYHLRRKATPDPKVVFILTAIGQLIFIVAFMGPLTYVAGAFNFPLRDGLYLAIDRALGLDPRAILDFFNARPDLAVWLEAGYGMIRWPLLGIPVILAMTMRLRRLQIFVMAFALALVATLVVSALVPAIGTYYGLGVLAEITPNLNTTIYAKQLHDIPALRDGTLRDLELFKLAGIVAFPSFHAASAILYAWALWPVRGFGIMAAFLNAAMLAATPVVGAHYLIDVFGGIAVALASIALAKRFAASMERDPARASFAISAAASQPTT